MVYFVVTLGVEVLWALFCLVCTLGGVFCASGCMMVDVLCWVICVVLFDVAIFDVCVLGF